MKKHLTLIFICVLAISISLQAQHKPPHQQHSKHKLERLATELNLSDEQKSKMETMSESLMKEMMVIKESDLTREEMHAEMKALGEKKKGIMKEILTAEQLEKMESIHPRKKRKRGDFSKEEMKAKKEEMKKKHEEMKKFMQEEIKPFMAEKRAELDKLMKKKDRKQINKLRDIAKEKHDEIKSEMKARKEAFKNGEKPKHLEGEERGKKPHHFGKKGGRKGHHIKKVHMKKFMEDNEAEFKKAQEYATKYADEIDQLISEIDAQHKIWKEEKKGDFDKGMKRGKGKQYMKRGAEACPKGGNGCCKKTPETCPKADSGCCAKGGEKSERKRPEGKMDKKMMKRIGFLLMPSEFKTEDEVLTREIEATETMTAKVFPNPSQNRNTLELNVEEKGKYLIELYNEKGQKVKVITNSKLEIGTQRFEVDLSNLPSGIYYYSISNGKNRSTQKFVKN